MNEINIDYNTKIACSQVSAILECFDQKKLIMYIPQEIINEIKNNSANDYKYNVDLDNFDVNTLTDEATALLMLIYKEYLANENQKKKLDSFFDYCSQSVYSYENLFNNKANSEEQDIVDNLDNTDNKPIDVYSKTSIVVHIIEKIKDFFRKGE